MDDFGSSNKSAEIKFHHSDIKLKLPSLMLPKSSKAIMTTLIKTQYNVKATYPTVIQYTEDHEMSISPQHSNKLNISTSHLPPFHAKLHDQKRGEGTK